MIRERFELTASRARRLLSAEIRGLQAAAYVLAAAAFLSSLLALVRDRLLAHTFGASTTLDIYYAGFRIPDLIFVCTGALVSVYMLIPELARRSEAAQKNYIDTIVSGFSLFSIGITLLAELLAPFILRGLFPEFSGAEFAQLVLVTRIILVQPILLGFSNIFAAVTQSRHRYVLYSASPLLYNLGIIVGVEFLYPSFGIVGLAWGVVIGSVLHAGIQVPSLITDGFLNRIPLIREPRALLTTAALSIPRALALSMGQVTYLGLIALAGTLVSGSIAVFVFAYNLQAVPLAVIGASFSVAAFPTLSAALSRGQTEEFIEHVAAAARYVFFWSIPASLLILVLRAYLVRVILGSGAFDWTDTRLTAAAFALLSFSLAAQGIQLLLFRGYYAAGRSLAPFLVSIGVAAGTLLVGMFTLGLLHAPYLLHTVETLMRVEDVPGSPVVALAFAYSVASILGALATMLHFEYRFGGFLRRIGRTFFQSIGAALCGSIIAYVTLSFFSPLLQTTATIDVFLLGLAGGVAGLAGVFALYAAVGSREYKETFTAIHARLWRKAEEIEGVTLTTSAETDLPHA